MFGYVMPQQNLLTPEENARYRAFYCGLCRTLGKKYGITARFALTYDMTFLALFLASFYEPEEKRGTLRCMVHPAKRREFVQNAALEYAADMTVALFYHKAMDDWQDDKNAAARILALRFKKAYAAVRKAYPVQCAAIESALSALSAIEKENGDADAAAGCFGSVLSAVFTYRQDVWTKHMQSFGDFLGRFIYIMDAALDKEKDKKSGSFNPLLCYSTTEEEEIMTAYIADAAAIFEKMPFVEDAAILHNILYAGVWQKYDAVKKGETDDTRSVCGARCFAKRHTRRS